ncbi:LAMI_0D05974g1_1 [Lachancea mirantina]|uniref:LAMI_0D05974g1_1 n=1 Tax=Lachancea mirantina TaxID=1230905 RepID=A0A1G4JC08_9SACH|nr:LAMI_0D05974g1_1 [Lachancea mirantina]
MANLQLQDPFSVLKEYPEKLTQILVSPIYTCCIRFSPRGDYLAAGCSNGAIVIYDIDTAKPITMLGSEGGCHIRSVQSLSWSRCGRYLLSSGRDWWIKVWDLQSRSRPLKEHKFDSPIWECHWSSRAPWECISTVLEKSYAYVVDFVGEEAIVQELKSTLDNDDAESLDHGYTLVSCSHPRFSDLVLTGTSKGWFKIYQLRQDGVTLRHCSKFANSNTKHLVISQSGDRIAINSSDRTIRQFSLFISDDMEHINIEIEHKYQDVINKLQWNSIFFSNNSAEYLIASTHGSSAHDIYLWETSSGTLVRVLEGTEEELLDIDWNFYNMCIAANGIETGNIYIWSIVIPPKWSALAPDFEEVDENIEYKEKEDEFDESDVLEQQQELDEAEETEIDLRALEKFDVRGNDLTMKSFIIPIEYSDIVMLKMWDGAGAA